ncbi:14801_t:CDS:2, partial [Racocetra persica]
NLIKPANSPFFIRDLIKPVKSSFSSVSNLIKQAGHTVTFIPQHNQILIIDGYLQGPIVSLDISTLIWSTLTISNNGLLPGLFWHTSALFDKYILVAF